MQRQQLVDFTKKKAHQPGGFIVIVAAIVGFIGAMLQSFIVTYGLVAALNTVIFTALFILLPCWILAILLGYICRRSGVSYDRVRAWFWKLPALLAWILAGYLGVTAGQSLSDPNGGNEDGLIVIFFYVTLGLIVAAITFVLALLRLIWLKKAQKSS